MQLEGHFWQAASAGSEGFFPLHCTVLAQSPQPLKNRGILIISSDCFVPLSSAELLSPLPLLREEGL